MRNPCPTLHYLEDFPLLEDRQILLIASHFILLPLQEELLGSLRVNALIEEMGVVALDP